MVILSPQSLVNKAAANISFSTRQTIIKELCLGYKLLAEGAPLAQIWKSEASSLAAFLIDYSSFVQVDVDYWGASCTSARALIGYMESCLSPPQRNDESMRQLIGVLGAFEDSVRKNTLYFDASTSFFAAAICTREDLLKHGNIEVDGPVWRDNGIDEALSTQEEPEAGMNTTSYWKEAEDNRDRQENS
ncbi:hypothetical protein ACEPAF_6789 [Sanghuangporus sanghuang]